MPTCPNCGRKNLENAAACEFCGILLVQTCPSCGSRVPAGNRFCGQCGAQVESLTPVSSLTPPTDEMATLQTRMLANLRDSIPIVLARKIENIASKMAGQRRDVTVLIASITNFTAASQQLDSDDISMLVDEMMHIVADVIYEYEGTIDRLTGDNLMAMFGLPINHENDPERAVRAALKMLQLVLPLQERLKQEYDLDIQIRIGINTGLVIAGSLGSQYHMEYTVIGDTVNLASHLVNRARPGTALVSFRAYQRTHPVFNYERLRPLRGKEDLPVLQAYRPLSIRTRPSQVRGLPGLQVPLVGRETDFRRLNEALSVVLDRRISQVVLLSGDAGIGKTRLVDEFYSALSELPLRVYLGTCASYMRITPYRVVADILRHIIHVSEVDPDEVQREALSYYLEQLNLEHQDLLPYLVNVLGISQAGTAAEIRLRLLDPAMLQRQIHSALRTFFVAEAARSAIILVFDDLDWIDPASRDFLSYFIQALDNFPILLVLMARNFTEGAAGTASTTTPLLAAAELKGSDLWKIHLEPFSTQVSRMLVDQLVCATEPKTSAVKDQIIARAGGNPYYTEELVRFLLDNDGLVHQGNSWLITDAASHLVQEVPGTLQDIILARFDLLPPQLKETLQKAAVLRSAFSIHLLMKISEEVKSDLLLSLKELENRGFLTRTSLGREDGYAFNHPLLQETIYNTLVTRDLRPLHLRIAMAVEAESTSVLGDLDDILAYHYSESTTPLKSIPYLLRSGENAAWRFANEAAVNSYRQALSLMESSVDISEDELIQAQIGLGRAQKFTGDFEDALKVLTNALTRLNPDQLLGKPADTNRIELTLECIRQLADIRTREGRLELAIELLQQGLKYLDFTGSAQVLLLGKRLADRLAWVYFRQGRLQEAFELANQALIVEAYTWQKDDPITLASLYNTLGGIYWFRSRYKDAIECVKHSLEVYKNLNYFWGMAVAYTNLGVLQYSVGKWPEAIADLEQADALRAKNGDVLERPTSLKNLGEALICTGEFEQARQKFQTSLEISQRYGMNLAAFYAETGLCRLSISEGRLEEAAAHLENARSLYGTSNTELDDRVIQLNLLQAHLKLETGDYPAGMEAAQKAFQLAVDGDFLAEKNESLCILGGLKTHTGQYEAAERDLLEGAQSSESQGDPYHQAQALYELSQLYQACSQVDPDNPAGQIQKARVSLQAAIDLFASLGAKHYLARARKAMEKIAPPA